MPGDFILMFCFSLSKLLLCYKNDCKLLDEDCDTYISWEPFAAYCLSIYYIFDV